MREDVGYAGTVSCLCLRAIASAILERGTSVLSGGEEDGMGEVPSREDHFRPGMAFWR